MYEVDTTNLRLRHIVSTTYRGSVYSLKVSGYANHYAFLQCRGMGGWVESIQVNVQTIADTPGVQLCRMEIEDPDDHSPVRLYVHICKGYNI